MIASGIIQSLLGNGLEYYNKKRFYVDIYNKLEGLDQKYLIMELLENTETMEEEQLSETLHESTFQYIPCTLPAGSDKHLHFPT